MKNLKTTLVSISLLFITVSSVNAQTSNIENSNNRYSDLTYDYFYNKNSRVSVNVKRVIASDPKSSAETLKILTNDNDVAVWLSAKENLKNQ